MLYHKNFYIAIAFNCILQIKKLCNLDILNTSKKHSFISMFTYFYLVKLYNIYIYSPKAFSDFHVFYSPFFYEFYYCFFNLILCSFNFVIYIFILHLHLFSVKQFYITFLLQFFRKILNSTLGRSKT